MSDMSVINSSTSDAIDQLVVDAGRMHKVINGTAAETITVEDGSLIPSLRKAMLENLYYKTPVLDWQNGSVTQVFNQLYAFTEPTSGAVSWWYAPSATATNPVSMGQTPATDANWRVVLDSATLTGLYATIDSPNFTGLPTAPTMDDDDSSTSIATTAFVNAVILKVLQDINAGNLDAATITVTGDASIFNLEATTATVTGKLTVQDLEILGDVTGIQTSVDGEDISPKSITTTEKLEVGGDTILHGVFQLAGNIVTLGDGTQVDLTNIGSSGTITTSFNLDSEVGNVNFVWDATTLNAPIFGSSGKGMTIAKDAQNVTQVTWPDNSQSAWVRTMTAGTFGDWSNSIASNTEAVAGTSTDKSLSPASGMALLANYGIATQTVNVESDLNNVVAGKMFAFMAATPNAPIAEVGGRGILMPSSEGEASMLVLENANQRLFIRYLTGGVWGDWVEFEGKEGPKGDIGDKGEPGASAYEVYVSTVPEGETPLEPEEWIASLQGSSFSVNQTGTTAERDQYDGEAKGFAFLDTTTGLLYIKNSATSGDWSDGIPFKGDKGDAGTNGATWYTGTTVPAAGTGVNNDLYYLTTTGDVYKKTSGAWAIIGNIKGTKGDDGDPGTDGATWYDGNVVPSASLGVDGDFYLLNSTADVYVKASGAWAVQTNLKGIQGDDGEKGSEWMWGNVAPTNDVGRDGDFFLVVPTVPTDTSNGDVYSKASGAWSYIGNIRGADGDGSGTGGDGAKWFNGTDVPASSLGAEGDYYLRTTTVSTTAGNGDVYVKGASAWTLTGNIKGADGTGSSYVLPVATATVLGGVKIGSGVTVAADGTISVSSSGGGSGTTWLNGTSDPTSATGAAGNYYNNTSTGVVWYRASTTWAQVGVLLPIATTAQAQAATSNLLLMTPAHTREYMEQYGFTATYVNVSANLNTVSGTTDKTQIFSWDNTSTNTPVASSYGRGIQIAGGGNYTTQFGFINDSGAAYIRFNSGGTWSAWKAFGGSSAVMGASGTNHAAGLAPDPGATAGTTRFLREDATWAVPAGGSGGGGGAAVFTAGQLTNTISLNASSATTIAMTAGTTTIDSTMLYKFSAVLLLQGPAGAKIDLTLTDIGPDIFRMRAHFTKADGTIGSARSTQASGAMTVELFDQDSTIIVDGIMHSSYYGTNGPQFQGKINTGDWCNAIKGSVITMTPIVTVPST